MRDRHATHNARKVNDDQHTDQPSFLREKLRTLFAPRKLRLFQLRSLQAFGFFLLGERNFYTGRPPERVKARR